LEDWAYKELYELEDDHWWFRSRRHVVWALLRRERLPAPARILDAGCGTGRNLVEYAKLGEVEGVDMSEQAVEFCHRRGFDGVRQASLEDLPFEDDRFDLITATDVIEHLDDDVGVLRELRRVAAPDGRLVVTVPAYQWLWTQHDESLHHKRRYTAERLRRAVTAAGWTPRNETYFFMSMLPPVALVRGLRRLRPAADENSDLALTTGTLNRLLDLPMKGEARLIGRGRRLPAGVSLGMVCGPSR
jgi:SAM-dependent methyltransferase